MGQVQILQNIEGEAPELAGDDVIRAEITKVGCLPGGMSSGRTSVSFVGEVDGRPVLMETSLKTLQMAMAYFTAHYGDETGQVKVTAVEGTTAIVEPDEPPGEN